MVFFWKDWLAMVSVVDESHKVLSRLSSRIQVLFDMKDLRALNHQICDLRRTDGQSVTLRCELVSPRVVQVNFQKFYPCVNFCNFHNFVLTVE